MDELYAKTEQELLAMARAKGVKFPEYYSLPYHIVGPIKINRSEAYRYDIEDHTQFWHHLLTHPDLDTIEIYSLKAGPNFFKNYFAKQYAEQDRSLFNKRHIIVAMLSENPDKPVIL